MNSDDFQDRWDEARHYSERYGYLPSVTQPRKTHEN